MMKIIYNLETIAASILIYYLKAITVLVKAILNPESERYSTTIIFLETQGQYYVKKPERFTINSSKQTMV